MRKFFVFASSNTLFRRYLVTHKLSNYKVEVVENRKKRDKNYLQIKIGGKLVGFFEEKDLGVEVKKGDIVSCKIIQKGKFFDGTDLKVMDIDSADLKIEEKLKIDQIIERKTDRRPGGSVSKLHAGSRIYHFEVKNSSRGDKYLIITEQSGDKRNRIFIFEDHAEKFSQKLAENLEKLK